MQIQSSMIILISEIRFQYLSKTKTRSKVLRPQKVNGAEINLSLIMVT